MGVLKPQVRVDKNGKHVTRHVKEIALPNVFSRNVGSIVPATSAATFEELCLKITQEDKEQAIKRIIFDAAHGREWYSTMGRKPRNYRNLKRFERIYRRNMEKSPDFKVLMEQDAAEICKLRAHVRSYDAGIPTPFDELFERIWDGKDGRRPLRESIDERLNILLNMANDLSTGKISASQVYSLTDDKKVALEHIDSQIKELNESRRTHGRSDFFIVKFVNRSMD